MSARLREDASIGEGPWAALRFQVLQAADLDEVMHIEGSVYDFPWTRGNFNDSIRAGYSCWAARLDGELVGYCIIMIGADEAHLLNLSVAAVHQRRGLGRRILTHVLRVACDHAARLLFLEVRPSNVPARHLYETSGFRQIGTRRNYYPAQVGREDALVLAIDLPGAP